MNDFFSPRLHVRIDGATASARVLTELKGAGSVVDLNELRALIAAGDPVLDIEMFTNDWYNGDAARILDLLLGWEKQGIGYTLHEAYAEPDGGEDVCCTSRITLDELGNIVQAAWEERVRQEKIDDLRYGDAP